MTPEEIFDPKTVREGRFNARETYPAFFFFSARRHQRSRFAWVRRPAKWTGRARFVRSRFHGGPDESQSKGCPFFGLRRAVSVGRPGFTFVQAAQRPRLAGLRGGAKTSVGCTPRTAQKRDGDITDIEDCAKK